MPRICRVCWDTVTGGPPLQGAGGTRRWWAQTTGVRRGPARPDRAVPGAGRRGSGGAEGLQEESPWGRFDLAPLPEALPSSDG